MPYRPDPNGPGACASGRRGRRADELATRYRDRVVIFDSAPVLATSGATVLAHLAGQVVMVVEAVRTPQGAVREALRLLEPVQNISLVLNKSRERYGGGYGKGYYYGYGYGYGTEKVKDRA